MKVYENPGLWCMPCTELLEASLCEEKSKEIEINLGKGHGILNQLYKEWIIPAIEWANENQKRDQQKYK